MDTTFRLATEAELDALAEVRRLRMALAGIQGHAEYAAGIASSQEGQDAHTRIAEQAREALEGAAIERELRAEAAGRRG